MVLDKDYSLYTLPIAVGADGTPEVRSWTVYPPLGGGSLTSNATTLTEMPGTSFADGFPRLYIGGDDGVIVRALPDPGPPTIDEQIRLLAGSSILALTPIPQVGYVALGVSTGMSLFGISESTGTPTISFELNRPPNPCLDFKVFESLEVSPNPVLPIHLIVATGVDPPRAAAMPRRAGPRPCRASRG